MIGVGQLTDRLLAIRDLPTFPTTALEVMRLASDSDSSAAELAKIISRDPPLADAVATAMGNRVHKPADLGHAVKWALGISGVDGALAVLGDKIAALGEIELVPLGH